MFFILIIMVGVLTTILITPAQGEYIKKERINLSALVRAKLDSLMED